MICTIVIALLAIGWRNAAGVPIDVQSTLEIIPAEEREDFLRYQAQRGYDLMVMEQNGHNGQNSKSIPDEFAVKVYEYILSRDIVCFEDGTCIDIGDIGVHPIA